MHVQSESIADRTTARITEFKPGASPPPVSRPTLRGKSLDALVCGDSFVIASIVQALVVERAAAFASASQGEMIGAP